MHRPDLTARIRRFAWMEDAAAQTVVLCLLGRLVPAWIALPEIAVARDNVVETFQTIWREPVLSEVLQLRGLS